MPIKPENVTRYPGNWVEIWARILVRAGNRCEHCGVPNYALGGRTQDGKWHVAWPLGEKRLTLEWPRPGQWATCGSQANPQYLRVIRIVLTIAHLDHTPENCAVDNLRAWCQRCHLAYDAKHHRENAYRTRRMGKAVSDLFATEA